jgi:hypothetical protein
LVRAADLIGYLGDPHYLRKTNALFCEFQETGHNRQFGYETSTDLTNLFPQFYYNRVAPHIQSAIRYLNVTSSGRRWIANLYSNVFRAERGWSLLPDSSPAGQEHGRTIPLADVEQDATQSPRRRGRASAGR